MPAGRSPHHEYARHRPESTLLHQLVRERGHSLLVVTHDPSVRSFADRVLTIRDGILTQ
jgi:ABC-type lipoprotein export system ATPase subunit